TDKLIYRNSKNIQTFTDFQSRKRLSLNKDTVTKNNQNWGLIFKLPQDIIALVTKIKASKKRLSELFPETSQGLIAYDKYKGQSKEVIKNRAYHHFDNPKGIYKKWL